MTNLPEGATHIWTPAVLRPYVGMFKRLAYFKQIEGVWWVYSELTNWRKARNPDKWFQEEISEGYFVTIEKFLSKGFIPKKEKV